MVDQFINPYTSSYAPNGFGQQDQQGLGPVFQNTNAQQQYLANQLREQHQISQPRQQQGGGMGGFNPSTLANMLKNKPAQQPNQNPANVHDFSQPYDQYTGIDQWLNNGGNFSMNDYMGQMGLDAGGQFSGAGDFSLGSNGLDLGGSSLGDVGTSLDGLWQGIGSIGDWFGGLFGGGGALEGVGAAAEEAAPAAAAAL
jgi:hypothetical protein